MKINRGLRLIAIHTILIVALIVPQLVSAMVMIGSVLPQDVHSVATTETASLAEIADAPAPESLPPGSSASELRTSLAAVQESEPITASLLNDTAPGGQTNDDGITRDPTIVGELSSPTEVQTLRAHFGLGEDDKDISQAVQGDGTFLLDETELEAILGRSLDDGPYDLFLEGFDQNGETLGVTSVAFFLDTTPPQPQLYAPQNGDRLNEALSFIDVAYVDISGIAPQTLDSDDIVIGSGTSVITPVGVNITSDGFFRYEFTEQPEAGVVTVSFANEAVSDVAGNLSAEGIGSFEYSPLPEGLALAAAMPQINDVPGRAPNQPQEAYINPAYNEDSGRSVYLHSGEAFMKRVDLEIPGRGFDFLFERTYRSGWEDSRTPLGRNWDFNYNRRLFKAFDDNQFDCFSHFGHVCNTHDVIRIDGHREDLYRAVIDTDRPDGENIIQWESPPGFYTKLTETTDGRLLERDQNGTIFTYKQDDTCVGDFTRGLHLLISVEDRNGNSIKLNYSDSECGHLAFVEDTMGRRIDFLYDDLGQLIIMRDFTGREVRFDYDKLFRLVAVTGPRVVNTPHGNDFPDGKTERYTYHGDSTRIHEVIAPNEVTNGDNTSRETYKYYEDTGRVESQTVGGINAHGVPAGGTFEYTYSQVSEIGIPCTMMNEEGEANEETPPAVLHPCTIVTDRNGNETEYHFSALGNISLTREVTNRNIRAIDPDAFYEIKSFNPDGQQLTVTYDEGNVVEYHFDDGQSTTRFQEGNLLSIVKYPDGRGSDQNQLRTVYTYESIYNQRSTEIDPGGDETGYIYDYQEGENYEALAAEMSRSPDEVETLLDAAGIDMGLGDVNGDGRTDQINGNLIQIKYPTVKLTPDSQQAQLEGDTEQEIVQTYVYNEFGQKIRETDPEGNVTRYQYYSEVDPDGDGTDNNPRGDTETGGYLKQIRRDAGATRNSGTNQPPANIRTQYKYDSSGNVTEKTDPRGVVTDYVVNELNQVVQVVRAADHIIQLIIPLDVSDSSDVDGTSQSPSSPSQPESGERAEEVAEESPTSLIVEEPLPLQDFAFVERIWFDANDNPVLHQVEDRGNTSMVDGNLPAPQGIQTTPISVDFEEAVVGTSETYVEENTVFLPRLDPTEFCQAEPCPRPFLQFAIDAGKRSLTLIADSTKERVEVKNEDGHPFVVAGLDITHLTGDGSEWEIRAADDKRMVIDSSTILDLSAWQDIESFTIVPLTDAGSIAINGLEIAQTPDPVGGEFAFVDEQNLYDILDNRIATIQEASNAPSPHFLTTLYRYDANQNLVMTIHPEGNADGAIYDERDLLHKTIRGVYESVAGALMSPTDPTEFNVRGGLPCNCSTYEVDGNGNVIAVVDAADTDGSPDNNYPELGPGDRTRHLYDGFDRLVSTVDSVGNQMVYQYNADSQVIRELYFGPTGGPSPQSDGPERLYSPVFNGVIQSSNLVSMSLMAAVEHNYDELDRLSYNQQLLFINTTPTTRTPDVADGAADLGKGNLTPDDSQAIPGLDGVDILGRVTTITEYDRNSRSTFTVEDDGDIFTTLYDGANRVIKQVDPEGNVVDLAYDGNNNLIEQQEIDHSQQGDQSEIFLTTYFYDSLNRLQRAVDNIGQTTYYRYDSRNNMVATADAEGPSGDAIERRFFPDGPLTNNTINGYGNITRHYYDGLNRQIFQEMLLTESGTGDGTHIGASLEGVKSDLQVAESHTPQPDKTQAGGDGIIRLGTTHDDNSLVSAQIDDQGNIGLYLYDNLDRRVVETKGLMVVSTGLSYTSILEPRRVVMPTMETLNSPAAIEESLINAQLAEAEQRLERVVSKFPSLADQVDDPPTSVIYSYSPDSNLLIVEDENDNELFTRYDAINRPFANRIFRSEQNDSHVDDPIFAPDPARDRSQPGSSVVVIGTTRQNLQYDGLSRVTLATDNNDLQNNTDDSIVTFAYDSLGRPIEEGQQLGQSAPQIVSSSWRAANLRLGLTYPNDRQIQFTYDNLDRLDTIQDEGATEDLVDYDYIGLSRVLERHYPINGTRLTYLDDSGEIDAGYDGLRRPIQLRHLESSGSLLVGFTHTYDRLNNKLDETKLHDPANNEAYRYDSAYRLTEFERSQPGAIPPQYKDWSLDGAGNWTAVNGEEETREHSAFNEITTRLIDGTSIALSYDDNGNLTDDGELLFEWDAFNRLRRVTHEAEDTVIAEYAYDSFSRRISKTIKNFGTLNGITTYYYDGQRALEEQTGDGQVIQQYVYGNYIDEVLVLDRNLDSDSIATGDNDHRLFYHQNSLMSVYALTNEQGKIVEGYQYDAYGRQTVFHPGVNEVVNFGDDDEIVVAGPSSFGNPYMFTGRRFDAETGLVYYRARYLSPKLGRFISRDPLGCWGDAANMGNGHTYVGNSPGNLLDPQGTDTRKMEVNASKSAYHIGQTVVETGPGGCHIFYEVTDVTYQLTGDSALYTLEKQDEWCPPQDPGGGFKVEEPMPGDPSPNDTQDENNNTSLKSSACQECQTKAKTKTKTEQNECNEGSVGAAASGVAVGGVLGAAGGAFVGLVVGCFLGPGGCALGAQAGWGLGAAAGGYGGSVVGGTNEFAKHRIFCLKKAEALKEYELGLCNRNECRN